MRALTPKVGDGGCGQSSSRGSSLCLDCTCFSYRARMYPKGTKGRPADDLRCEYSEGQRSNRGTEQHERVYDVLHFPTSPGTKIIRVTSYCDVILA